MAATPGVLLRPLNLFLMSKRYKGKINIQRPKNPHYDRQLLLDLTRPFYKPKEPFSEQKLCTALRDTKFVKKEIDNPFERILANECLNWFNTSKMVIFLHMNPMSQEDTLPIYGTLVKNNMYLRKYGRKIVGMATTGTRYEAVNCLFQNHQNIIFGQPENIGKLFKILKKAPAMVVMAGIIEDKLLSKNELMEFSQLPSLDVARSQLCSILDNAGSSLVNQLQLSQQTLVSHLDKHVEMNSSSSSENVDKKE